MCGTRVFNIFTSEETFENIYLTFCLTSEIIFTFNVKNIKYSVYCILFFLTCFFQMVDAACNTHHDVIVQWIKPSI